MSRVRECEVSGLVDDGSVIVFEPMKCFATLATASTCLANERLRSARHCCIGHLLNENDVNIFETIETRHFNTSNYIRSVRWRI